MVSGVKFSVDRLTDTPTSLRFEADAAWWRDSSAVRGEFADALRGPLRFELSAYTMGREVYVEGAAQADLELGCSRCLARYRFALREPFRIVLEPAGERVPVEPEAAPTFARDGLCLGDELEAGWYRGSEIDLTSYLREVVALALPVQPLCTQECRGLCPRCGVDRNVKTCSCAEPSASSPFAALRALRVEEGES